jgi:hypothetical protein
MTTSVPIGLGLSFASALAVNWAYSREHDAAATLPPISARRPLHSASLLVRNRAWMIAFGAETGGWLLYIAALRLAPLALVQAVGASGIAILALLQVHGDVRRLARRDRIAVFLAVAGLVLLAISLAGARAPDHTPRVLGVVVWLAACFGGAAFLTVARLSLARAAVLGLAAGLLFAGGDISAKLVVYGGYWLVALVPLIVAYALGSIGLQGAFQQGSALTAAGMATLATNAIPIAAGVILFGETLPGGAGRILQIAAFAAVVASATLLTDPRARKAMEAT